MRKKTSPHSRASRWDKKRPKTSDGNLYITGLNGVRECLNSPDVKVRQIWADPTRITPQLWEMLAPYKPIMEEARGRETPYGPIDQGFAALVQPPQWPDLDDLLDKISQENRNTLFVALDQVEDPMNLGQILRTCEGAGVDALLAPSHRSAKINQTVAQISQGAFAWVPFLEIGNLRQTLDGLKQKGLWVVGCEAGPNSKLWSEQDFTDGTVLVLGAEGKGLRELSRKTCDFLVRLPMAGRLDSLNVGAAASALLYEANRQRIQQSTS